jgi:long-chain acyl-CoA synthetase
MNLYDQFRQTALRQPEFPAIVGPQQQHRLTYRALDEAICAARERLRALGVRPGDCVGLHYSSSVQYIICTYAVWGCGGCVVPLATELAAAEKQEICRSLALDYVISQPRGIAALELFRRGAAAEVGPECLLVPLRQLCDHPDGFHALNAAFIRFSSGTTGTSKGVVLSHETIDERIQAANEALDIGPRDRVLWVLSMAYHFTVSIVAYLTFGATIVLPANHFAAAIVEAIERNRATLLYASPMHYALLADYPGAAPLRSLRMALSTTSSLEERVAAEFHHRYRQPIGQALGIIEAGLPCIHVDSTAQRWASVGRLLPAYRMRLEDAGLGAGAKEILLSGPGFLDAYYHPWQTRREIMPDGWFRTGDVGWLDEQGFLYLSGRTKEVISVMGMKFFPREVEQVLASHPAVEAASVFAGGDGRWGEAVCARVVARNGSANPALKEQLRQYCQERMASYKAPERIEFVASLPRTASGKVLHRAI